MKLSELIAKGQEMLLQYGDGEVVTEGCDCIGDSDRIEFIGQEGYEYEICRSRPTY